MLLRNATALFRNHHEVKANPSQHRELKQARLKLLHSHSVPEEDSQAIKKTSVIVTEKSRFADVQTEMLASLTCYSMPENSARRNECHCNASSNHYTQC